MCESYFNINYVFSLVDIKHLIHTNKVVKDVTITKDITNMETCTGNYIYLEKGYNTYMCKSGCGTGKTHGFFDYVMRMKKKKHYKVVSITSRVSLVSQHIETFNKLKKEYPNMTENINSYQDHNTNLNDVDNLVIQLDSIGQLNTDFFNSENPGHSTILFLDEINSLWLYLTHSSTLNHRRLIVCQRLIELIRLADVLVVSDNDLAQSTIDSIRDIRGLEKSTLITHDYQKYKNINATFHVNEQDFYMQMVASAKKNPNIMATFDEKATMKQYVEQLERDGFVDLKVYSSEEGDEIISTDGWKGKIVLFTPRIVYGTDYSLDNDELAVVFSHCKVEHLHLYRSTNSSVDAVQLRRSIFIATFQINDWNMIAWMI